MLWVALGPAVSPRRARRGGRVERRARRSSALVFAMVLTGALVAGDPRGLRLQHLSAHERALDPARDPAASIRGGGTSSTTWPPCSSTIACSRVIVVACTAALVWRRCGATPDSRPAREAWSRPRSSGAAPRCRSPLGISTLLMASPVPLAAMHQAGAVVVFTCAVALWQALRGEARAQPPRAAASTATITSNA